MFYINITSAITNNMETYHLNDNDNFLLNINE